MKRRKTVSYHKYLIKSLRDPEEAAGYLNAALEEGDMFYFLIALRHVVEAQGGMTKLARKTKRHRVSLYKMLSKKGNPEIKTIDDVLHAFGMRMSVELLVPPSKR